VCVCLCLCVCMCVRAITHVIYASNAKQNETELNSMNMGLCEQFFEWAIAIASMHIGLSASGLLSALPSARYDDCRARPI